MTTATTPQDPAETFLVEVKNQMPTVEGEGVDRCPVSFGDTSRQLVEAIVPAIPITSMTFMTDSDFMSRAAFAATSGTAVRLRIHAFLPPMSASSDDPSGGATTCLFGSLQRVVCMNDP